MYHIHSSAVNSPILVICVNAGMDLTSAMECYGKVVNLLQDFWLVDLEVKLNSLIFDDIKVALGIH